MGARGVVVAITMGVAAVAPATGAGAVFPAGVTYGGLTTGQRGLITIEDNPLHTRVVQFRVDWDSTCTLGPAGVAGTTETEAAWAAEGRSFAIRKNGSWSVTVTLPGLSQDGVLRTYRYVIAGRRANGRMIGSFRGTVLEKTPDGASEIRTCKSGVVKFNLAERHVFAGVTSQREKIVVEMNAARTRVKGLRWWWNSTCTAGPEATPATVLTFDGPDRITDFSVKNNRWGGDLLFPPFADPATGITSQFGYAIRALRHGQKMNGTINATYTETDTATGQLIRTCASGKVTFKIKD